jgi:hypothetical protein
MPDQPLERSGNSTPSGSLRYCQMSLQICVEAVLQETEPAEAMCDVRQPTAGIFAACVITSEGRQEEPDHSVAKHFVRMVH